MQWSNSGAWGTVIGYDVREIWRRARGLGGLADLIGCRGFLCRRGKHAGSVRSQVRSQVLVRHNPVFLPIHILLQYSSSYSSLDTYKIASYYLLSNLYCADI